MKKLIFLAILIFPLFKSYSQTPPGQIPNLTQYRPEYCDRDDSAKSRTCTVGYAKWEHAYVAWYITSNIQDTLAFWSMYNMAKTGILINAVRLDSRSIRQMDADGRIIPLWSSDEGKLIMPVRFKGFKP